MLSGLRSLGAVTSRRHFVSLAAVLSRDGANSQLLRHLPIYPLQLQQLQARHIMSASVEDVRSTVRQLLPTVDMNTTSERKIRELLAEQLGTPMDPHKKLIKEEIDRWLIEQAGADAAGSGDDDMSMPPSSLDPVGKRKRAAAEPGERAAKVARSSSGADGGPPGGVQLDTKGLKWLSVSTLKGQQRVDLRNFFKTSTGEPAPTKKGISFSQADWSALQAVIPAVSKALDDHDEDFVAELPGNRRATVSVFSGKLQVGVREYYEDGGELKPGQKGLNMLPDEWEVFCEAVPDINKQLTNPPPSAAPARAAPAAAGPAASRAAPGKAAAVAAAGGADGAEVQLGGKKRAAISTFSGSAQVDLRECYEKDGQMLPSKKGISLKPDQWRTLAGAAEAITSALNAHNTRYVLELGNKRRVTISEFRNVWYVGVREFYEKNGELLPGGKGLNMNREQWQKLVAGMDMLTEQLG